MALLNVAYTLAGYGRHVLVVDMDLEAPGLSGLLARSGEYSEPGLGDPFDVLTLLDEVIRLERSGSAPEQAVSAIAPLSNFIRSVTPDRLAPLQPRIGVPGRLDVLWANQRKNYTSRLANLPLSSLRREEIVAVSRLLRRYLVSQRFTFRPLWLEDFEQPIETAYDYILVDSRTGITEIGGLCVGPLSDRLVVLTGLNDQNMTGTGEFFEEVGIKLQVESGGTNAWDEDDPTPSQDHPALGPKPTIVVASPVPHGEIHVRGERLKALRNQFGLIPLTLSYHPQLALAEGIFVRAYPREHLTAEYRTLTRHVQARVFDAPEQLTMLLDKATNVGDSASVDDVPAAAIRLAAEEPGLALSLMRRWFDVRNGVVPRSAAWLLTHDTSFKHVALNAWGSRLAQEGLGFPFDASAPRFESAYAKFGAAIAVRPDYPDPYLNWALALRRRSENAPLEVANRLVADAEERFSRARTMGIASPRHGIQWAQELTQHARRLAGAARKELLDRAIVILNDAVESMSGRLAQLPESTDPEVRFTGPNSWEAGIDLNVDVFTERQSLRIDKAFALHRLGTALALRAEAEVKEASDGFFDEAYTKFEEATSLVKDSVLLANWALTLQRHAGRRGVTSARRLLEKAIDKFKQALVHDPGAVHLNASLGSVFADLAEIASEPRRSEYFDQAEAALSAAAEAQPDNANTRLLRASVLLERAELASGEIARNFFDRARAEIDHITVPAAAGAAFQVRGSIELAQAKKEGAGTVAMVAASVDSFRESLRLIPDTPNALTGMGAALFELSKVRPTERAALLEAARERLAEAGRAGLLELARLETVEGNYEAAIQALCRMRDSCELTAARYLRKVPEFAALERYADYRSLLDSLEQDD